MNKYCDGLDCAFCDEKEPCIYKLKAENEELKTYVQITPDGIIVNDTENFTRVCALEQKLEKIKEYCNQTLSLMKNDSGNNPYACGRTIEAENVLKIIEEK